MLFYLIFEYSYLYTYTSDWFAIISEIITIKCIIYYLNISICI